MGDVAARAGVGKITVSRALRTPTKVSPETLEKVRAAVADLGYVLDETAGALSSQRSRIVGALVSTLDQPVFASTIRGLTEGLAEGGLHLLLATTQYDPDTEARLIPALLGRRPEALVLTSTRHTPAARRLLAASGVPSVEVWELPEPPLCAAVGFSNRAAGEAMARHLVDTGRRGIAFLSVERPGDTRAQQRRDGYRLAIQGVQTPREVLLGPEPGWSGPDYGARGLAQARDRWPDTDAVICVSDSLALGVWCEAMRRGWTVPGSLAITGFGDVDLAGDSGIGLTTVHVDGEAIGRATAGLIVAAAEGHAIAGRRVDLGFTLTRRATS